MTDKKITKLDRAKAIIDHHMDVESKSSSYRIVYKGGVWIGNPSEVDLNSVSLLYKYFVQDKVCGYVAVSVGVFVPTEGDVVFQVTSSDFRGNSPSDVIGYGGLFIKIGNLMNQIKQVTS